MYRAPGPEVRFGDIFEAPHLFDIFLREDGVALGTADLPARFAERFGQSAGVTIEGAIPLYSPYLPPRDGDFVLAHGTPQRAVLVSDNCTIATVFGYGRDRPRPNSRLLFAAVLDKPGEIDDVAVRRPFNRFALEKAGFFAGGIIDFRHLFIVHARAVDPEHRKASLLDDVLDELEVRFSAHTVRRGPLVIDRNADKLITLLRSAGIAEADANEAGAHVARALNLSWHAEGGALGDAAEAADDETPGQEPVQRLADDLRALATAAAEAATSLEAQLTRIT